ncbi:hypothetical protein ACWIB8_11125 [Corynebacterium flavescens]
MSYTLYQSLGLDRSLPPEALAAQIESMLAQPGLEAYRAGELQAAHAILGNPSKRGMYDRRIDDPVAPPMTVAEMQALAAAPLGGDPAKNPTETPREGLQEDRRENHTLGSIPAAASSEAGAKDSFAAVGTKLQEKLPVARAAIKRGATVAKQRFSQASVPVRVGVAAGAVAVVALGAVVGTGILDGKSGLRGGGQISASADSTYDADEIRKIAEASFAERVFLNPGDEVTIRSGKPYTYDDGRVERTGGGVDGVKIDNFRLIDEITKGDPDAPSDHPSAQDRKSGTWLCYDVIRRSIEEKEDYRLVLETEFPGNPDYVAERIAGSFTMPNMIDVQPIVDNAQAGYSVTSGGHVVVAPGSSTPLQRDGVGKSITVVGSRDGKSFDAEKDGVVFDRQSNSVVTSECWAVAGPSADSLNDDLLGAKVRKQADIPESITGFVVAPYFIDTDRYDTSPSWFDEMDGWRANL